LPVRITVEVDAKYGTAHAVVPVPRNATPANYNLQLWTATAANGMAGELIQAVDGEGAGSSVSRPISTVVPMAGPVPAATMAALSNTAAVNVMAAQPASTAGRRLQARTERPIIAVMPRPKQVMAAVPTDPGAHPPGVVMEAPSDLQEPNFGDYAGSDTPDGQIAGDEALTNGSSNNSSKRRLQQQEEKLGGTESVMLDEVPAQVEIIQDPALSEGVMPEAEPALTADQPKSKPEFPAFAGSTASAALPAPLPSARPVAAPLQPLGVSLAYTSFTVGDPRPPTATLAVSTTSSWVKPDGSVSITVATKSYVGSDVSGAEVTLKWSTGKAEGELLLTTNATGVATGTVELSKLPAGNRSDMGDSMTLKATWIGPTREPLSDSKTVK
jgi:hypothetical protein